MELIPGLRDQLDRLCVDPSVDPNWMLQRLFEGLRERYGTLAVGFARRRVVRPGRIQLLGLVDVDGEVVIPIPDDFRSDDRHPESVVDEADTEAWLAIDIFGSWRHEQVDTVFGRCRAVFLAPWLIDKPTDWLIVVLSPIAPPAGHREDRGLTVSANLLATNLLRALDAKRLERANAWIDRELEEIARLQTLLQPERRIELRGVDLAFSSHIFRYAGGDYVDIPRLTHLIDPADQHPEHDHFGVMIADVSGHGPSAAVEAAMLDAIMRTYPGPVDLGPEAAAAYINRHMFTRRPRAAFVSAFLCNYDPNRRELSYVNCGHPPPMVLDAKGRCVDLEVGDDIPLRIMPDYQWQRYVRRVKRGEWLILFTDGVTESRSPSGEELGREGLRRMIQPERSAARMVAAIRRGLRRHRHNRPPQDDQTLVVIRWD